MGAGLVHTEMVSALGLIYGSSKTLEILGDKDEAGPVVLQLFAPDAPNMCRGAEIALSAKHFAALEVNMACPMPKVTRHGSGSALMSRREEATRIARELQSFGLPVWIKIRIADTAAGSPATVALCDSLLDQGVDLLLVHGRTPAQRYEGTADKDIVTSLARKYPGKIAASGDVFTPHDAKIYLDGGCASVLAARGSVSDAYLIAKINESCGFLHPEIPIGSDMALRARDLASVGKMSASHENERFAAVLVKKMMAGFFKAIPGSTAARRRCAEMNTWQSIEHFLTELADGASVL